MKNPKTLLMFTSVLPQFIPAGSSPFPALLGVTFAGLGFASLTLYSLVLVRAGGVLRRPKLARRVMRGSPLCPAASWSALGSLSPPSGNGHDDGRALRLVLKSARQQR